MPDRSSVALQRDDKIAARARPRRLDEQLWAARRADQAMPLTGYYRPRTPLRAVLLVEFFRQGPWAA
jgi:hypothetical protein